MPQLLRYPNPADPLNGEAAALLMRDPKAYAKKVETYVERYATPADADGDEDEEDLNPKRKGKEVGQRRSDRTRRRDFSIVWSGLKRCYQLFLGPARFLNVSKCHDKADSSMIVLQRLNYCGRGNMLHSE